MRKALLCLIFGALVIGGAAPARADVRYERIGSPLVASTGSVAPQQVHAHYAAPVRGADGRLNIAATLDRLLSLGADTYEYLVYDHGPYHSAQDWADLPGFLSAARQRGVAVWVYLVPPTEASSTANPCGGDRYAPFGADYEQWFTAIGTLAASHSNLAAVVMDDFGLNVSGGPRAHCAAFTPTRVAALRALADTAAGRHLGFHPVMYRADLLGATASIEKFRGVVDGVVLPFTDIGGTTGDSLVRSVTTLLSCHAGPTASTRCLTATLPYRGTVAKGASAGATATLVPTSTSATVRFSWTAAMASRAYGVLAVQVLRDGKVVWQADPASISAGAWRTSSVPLTGLVPGKATVLTVRVVARTQLNNLGVRVKADDLTVSGGRLSAGGVSADGLHGDGWRLQRSTPWTAAFEGRLPVQWMVYAWPYHGIVPTPTTLANDLAVWRRNAAVLSGVCVYQLPLDPTTDLFRATQASLTEATTVNGTTTSATATATTG